MSVLWFSIISTQAGCSWKETLLEANAQFDRRDPIDRTVLLNAASGENSEALSLLLAAGANMDAVDNEEKWAPLMFAAVEGNIEAVRVVVQTRWQYGVQRRLRRNIAAVCCRDGPS